MLTASVQGIKRLTLVLCWLFSSLLAHKKGVTAFLDARPSVWAVILQDKQSDVFQFSMHFFW
jgi:hypothetical protein